MTVPRTHQFAAVAFEENLSLRELAASYPEARLGLRDMRLAAGDGGGIFIYPFGAVVFHDVTPERREAELARLYRARPGLTTQVVRESLTVCRRRWSSCSTSPATGACGSWK